MEANYQMETFLHDMIRNPEYFYDFDEKIQCQVCNREVLTFANANLIAGLILL